MIPTTTTTSDTSLCDSQELPLFLDNQQAGNMGLEHRRFSCPLTKKIMKDPVTTSSGNNFERKALLKCLKKNGNKCPITGESLRPYQVSANATLQWKILYWERKHESPSSGSENSSTKNTIPKRNHSDPVLPLDRKIDAPPIMPRSPSVLSTRKPLQQHGVDSAPTVPQRKSARRDRQQIRAKLAASRMARSYNMHDLLHALPMDSLAADPAASPPMMPTRCWNQDSIISIIDDVISVLSDEPTSLCS